MYQKKTNHSQYEFFIKTIKKSIWLIIMSVMIFFNFSFFIQVYAQEDTTVRKQQATEISNLLWSATSICSDLSDVNDCKNKLNILNDQVKEKAKEEIKDSYKQKTEECEWNINSVSFLDTVWLNWDNCFLMPKDWKQCYMYEETDEIYKLCIPWWQQWELAQDEHKKIEDIIKKLDNLENQWNDVTNLEKAYQECIDIQKWKEWDSTYPWLMSEDQSLIDCEKYAKWIENERGDIERRLSRIDEIEKDLESITAEWECNIKKEELKEFIKLQKEKYKSDNGDYRWDEQTTDDVDISWDWAVSDDVCPNYEQITVTFDPNQYANCGKRDTLRDIMRDIWQKKNLADRKYKILSDIVKQTCNSDIRLRDKNDDTDPIDEWNLDKFFEEECKISVRNLKKYKQWQTDFEKLYIWEFGIENWVISANPNWEWAFQEIYSTNISSLEDKEWLTYWLLESVTENIYWTNEIEIYTNMQSAISEIIKSKLDRYENRESSQDGDIDYLNSLKDQIKEEIKNWWDCSQIKIPSNKTCQELFASEYKQICEAIPWSYQFLDWKNSCVYGWWAVAWTDIPENEENYTNEINLKINNCESCEWWIHSSDWQCINSVYQPNWTAFWTITNCENIFLSKWIPSSDSTSLNSDIYKNVEQMIKDYNSTVGLLDWYKNKNIATWFQSTLDNNYILDIITTNWEIWQWFENIKTNACDNMTWYLSWLTKLEYPSWSGINKTDGDNITKSLYTLCGSINAINIQDLKNTSPSSPNYALKKSIINCNNNQSPDEMIKVYKYENSNGIITINIVEEKKCSDYTQKSDLIPIYRWYEIFVCNQCKQEWRAMSDGYCCEVWTVVATSEKWPICCNKNSTTTSKQCCAFGTTEDKTECISNSYWSMWIYCSPTQLINWNCYMKTYQFFGIKKNEWTPNPTVFIQDVILWITSFVWVVATIALLVSWFQFVMAGASGTVDESAKNWITYSLIWIALVAFSYVIIRVVQYIAKW